MLGTNELVSCCMTRRRRTPEWGLRGDDGNLSAGDAKDQKHEEEKAEHVVELVLPDAADDEKKLNENGAKRQNTCG